MDPKKDPNKNFGSKKGSTNKSIFKHIKKVIFLLYQLINTFF
jgi:hypothetical protein